MTVQGFSRAAILLLLPFFAACGADTLASNTADETSGGPPRVTVVRVEAIRPELRFREIGEVAAFDRLTLTPEVSGVALHVPYEPGMVITEEEPVVLRIEDTLYRLEKERAEAGLLAAVAGHDTAASDLARAEKLFADGTYSQKLLDAARLAERRAHAARLETQAVLDMAHERLADTVLAAPGGYTLTSRAVTEREYVVAGRPTFVLVDLRRVRVVLHVSAATLSILGKGTRIPLALKEIENHRFEGVVDRIIPEADPVLKRFRVELLAPNPDGVLRAGMSVAATITHSLDAVRLRVPFAAVGSSLRRHYCLIVDPAGRLARVTVRVSDDSPDPEYLHVEGIPEGTLVVADTSAPLSEDGIFVAVESPPGN